jgi:hypothetical protein
MTVSIISPAQQEALYQKYLAIHYAYKSDASFFTLTQSNTELTTVMGGRSWSWHVIGITDAALVRYKELEFKHVAKSGITRAHLTPRFQTTQKLLAESKPFSIGEFFSIWLAADKTVICGPGENKKEFNAEYLEIDNSNYELFNSKTIGWRFRVNEEGAFLRSLHLSRFG